METENHNVTLEDGEIESSQPKTFCGSGESHIDAFSYFPIKKRSIVFDGCNIGYK